MPLNTPAFRDAPSPKDGPLARLETLGKASALPQRVAGLFPSVSFVDGSALWAAIQAVRADATSLPDANGSSGVLRRAGNPGFVGLDAGSYHSLGVAVDGSAWSWGNNSDGKLGNGTTSNSHIPVQVPLPRGVTVRAISAGAFHSLAVATDGSLWAWGNNSDGQLGSGAATTTISPVPVQVALPGEISIEAASAGAFHSLALATDGSLWAWGNNEDGQLGSGSTALGSAAPVRLALPDGVSIRAVSAGSYHSLAVDTCGSPWAWGRNEDGQLGNGTDTAGLVPAMVARPWPEGITLASISAGAFHSLAVDTSGTLWAWGNNKKGQLGDSTTTLRAEPVQVRRTGPEGTTIEGVTAGRTHSLAVDSNGNVWAWGDNDNGQLGITDTTQRCEPVQVVRTWPEGTTVQSATAGGDHSMALVSNGTAFAWGNNAFGQLGTAPPLQSQPPRNQEEHHVEGA